MKNDLSTGMRDLPGAPDRQSRAGQKRQLHDDAGHDPAAAEPDRFRAFRRPIVMPGHANTFLPERLNRVSSTPGINSVMGNVNFDELVSQGQSLVKVNGIDTADGDTPGVERWRGHPTMPVPPLV
jgi:hypothetical protein